MMKMVIIVLVVVLTLPSKLPDNFTPQTHVYEWALRKFGYYDLPDFFLSDFRSHHAAKGTKYSDWQRALMNWVTWSSPSGQYYNAKVWESALEKCKAKLKAETIKIPLPIMKTTPKKANPETARLAIRQMMAGLRES